MFARIFSTALLLASVITGNALAAPPASGRLDFTVMREGTPIGHHTMSFRKAPDGMEVDIETRVAVKLAFITVYRFEHDGHELWRNGRLALLESTTNDDGAKHALKVQANGSKLSILGDGAKSTAAPDIIPASLWHEGVLRGGTLLNTLTGAPMRVEVQKVGSETVPVRGKVIAATHYAVTGELQRELWYDVDNVLVKVRFAGKDGSDIQYILR